MAIWESEWFEALQSHQSGYLDVARDQYESLLRRYPTDLPSEILFLLGTLKMQKEEWEAARNSLQDFVSQCPESWEAWNNLAICQSCLKQDKDAETSFKKSLSLNPKNPVGWKNLGDLFLRQTKYALAVEAFQNSLQCQPGQVLAIHDKAFTYFKMGQWSEAIRGWNEVLALKPDYADALANMSSLYFRLGDTQQSWRFAEKALILDANHLVALVTAGHLSNRSGHLSQAVDYYQKAISAHPSHGEVRHFLASTFIQKGQVEEGIALSRAALNEGYDDASSLSNYLQFLTYSDQISEEGILREHEARISEWVKKYKGELPSGASLPPGEGRIKIGYLSADFRRHSCAYFLKGIFENRDPSRFEVFVFSGVTTPDTITAFFKNHADHWHDGASLSDEEALRVIRAADLDILVDLSIHTEGNRWPLLVHQPARHQIAYLGCPNTTGIPQVSYKLVDENTDPVGHEALITEKPIRIPQSFLCYQSLDDAEVEVNESPFLENHHLTFGSFNNLSKVTPTTVRLWSQVLSAFPESRLILKSKVLINEGTRSYFTRLFEEEGIAPERLQLISFSQERGSHLRAYHQLDIALDTFPYHGTTTTCESFWMGVPVFSLIGKGHRSRVGLSLLSSIGYKEWAVGSPEEMIEGIRQLTSDVAVLRKCRQEMRQRMKSSVLHDAVGFTRRLESIYKGILER